MRGLLLTATSAPLRPDRHRKRPYAGSGWPRVALCVALLAAFVLAAGLLAGCVSENREIPSTTTAGSTAPSTGPVINPSPQSNAYTRELKRTALAVARLSDELEAANPPADDPRVGDLYALRARAQAVTASKALLDGQTALADEAAKNMRQLLNRSAAIAQGETQAAVQQALVHLESLGTPSGMDRQAAGSILDEVTADLGLLVEDESETAPTTG